MSMYGRSHLFTGRLFTDQQLIELHEQGLNDREIADSLGTEEDIVSRYRRRLRLKPPSTKFVFKRAIKNSQSYTCRAKFTDQQLIYLHSNGLRDVEIAEMLDALPGTVRNHRKKLGLKRNKLKTKVDYRQLMKSYKRGQRDNRSIFRFETETLNRRFTDQQLINLHRKGLTDAEIAETLSAIQSTVGGRRRRLGLKLNRHKPKVAI